MRPNVEMSTTTSPGLAASAAAELVVGRAGRVGADDDVGAGAASAASRAVDGDDDALARPGSRPRRAASGTRTRRRRTGRGGATGRRRAVRRSRRRRRGRRAGARRRPPPIVPPHASTRMPSSGATGARCALSRSGPSALPGAAPGAESELTLVSVSPRGISARGGTPPGRRRDTALAEVFARTPPCRYRGAHLDCQGAPRSTFPRTCCTGAIPSFVGRQHRSAAGSVSGTDRASASHDVSPRKRHSWPQRHSNSPSWNPRTRTNCWRSPRRSA